MPVKIEDRPLKNIREEVIDQLVINYAHQEITLAAFENRLDIAIDTEDRSVLMEQVADLELTSDKEYQRAKAAKLSEDEYFFDENSEYHQKITKFLSSDKQDGPWVTGEKITLTSVLSDFTLDFTEAIFNFPVVHIKVFGLLSSDTILVPEGVRVVCNASSFVSSINSHVFGSADEEAQTIIIHGTRILSSMEIKVPVTLKQKWLNFADGVKDPFN